MSFRPPTDASFSLNHKLFPSDWAPPENASIENMNKRHGFMANQVRLTPKNAFIALFVLVGLPIVVHKMASVEQRHKSGVAWGVGNPLVKEGSSTNNELSHAEIKKKAQTQPKWGGASFHFRSSAEDFSK